MTSDAQRKVVLITGTSSGFGKDTATLLAENGYWVFGTSRDPDSSSSGKFDMLKLDVSSDGSVESCISEVMKRAGRIDALVNNAGYISSEALEECTIEEAMAHFNTNFFGAVRMINASLPIMRRQKQGRIINISSMSDTIGAPFQGFYASTKAALTSYSESLRMEVKSFNIHVSVVEPGFFKTNLFRSKKMASKTVPEYDPLKSKVYAVLETDIKNGGEPIKVAQTVLKILQSDKPKLRYPVGKEGLFLVLKKIVPESLFESQVRAHFKMDK